jgi:hypothetical protein
MNQCFEDPFKKVILPRNQDHHQQDFFCLYAWILIKGIFTLQNITRVTVLGRLREYLFRSPRISHDTENTKATCPFETTNENGIWRME